MTNIKITDLPEQEAKKQLFLDKRLCVVSHSGLHRTESTLIERIPALTTPPSQVLVTGSRTGVLPMVIALQWPDVRVRCHALDIHHVETMERNLADNDVRGLAVVCSPMIPEGPYDLAFFSGTETTTTAELMLDQLEDLHEQLALGGVCWIAYEGDTGTWLKQIRQIFGNISAETDQRGFFCVSAKKTRPLPKRRSFRAEFKASVPGMDPITLASLPGVFCHRRPDMGGLALAEVAVKEQSQIPNLKSKILDMGCGSGLVGILLAKACPEVTVTFVDSHSRAIEATKQNLDALGMKRHTLVLSSRGVDQSGFDLFVGNPPYYSDFRIAELFVKTAFQVLKPGGVGFLVAKSAPGLDTCIKTRFPETTIIPRRGYSVIRFVK
jgi:16S rRNA (guanine1207-N2)-methyltransferase